MHLTSLGKQAHAQFFSFSQHELVIFSCRDLMPVLCCLARICFLFPNIITVTHCIIMVSQSGSYGLDFGWGGKGSNPSRAEAAAVVLNSA
jgi:hypothetical protein